ncbi:transcription-repair coupling factor (superfamily II helicase) [Actinoplanes octamycinicus]|uniref:Transcription-repair-coupling factor n=1 Tax=Actinoplanes octamycinicus TaxID=135948 RepID=A0A7W7GVB4_9ACTN|nr:transcription-repair coupling factor [Actinoplanes octamycinicus]MBB4738974.1 transcription-repair coupling factor (superfamily II helicase) [Actinoplanes octamycinicus]GIE60103.1 transcription-repair-coupling factor [Actinoplanes octamycinicus]
MQLAGLIPAALRDRGLARARDLARKGFVDSDAMDLTAPVSLRPFVVATVAGPADAGGAQRPVLAITATSREADDLADALGCLITPDRVAVYPSWETLPHERLSPRSDTVGKRLAVLRRLAHPGEEPLQVVVAPVRSLLQPQLKGLGDLEPVELVTGRGAELEEVARRLSDMAYARVDLVTKRGEFAVRGGILDVFPPTDEHPSRVEFWGDEVEEIRTFAVADQRTIDPVERLWAPPCRELLLTPAVRERAAQLAAQHPELAEILDKLSAGIPVEGMESLAPALLDGTDSMELLIDCMPAGTHVLLCDPERIRTRAHDLTRTSDEFLEASWAAAAVGGQAPIDVGAVAFRSLADVRAHAAVLKQPWWTISPFGLAVADEPAALPWEDAAPVEVTPDTGDAIALAAQPVPLYHGDTAKLAGDLSEWASAGWAIALVFEGKGTAQRATELLRDAGLGVTPVEAISNPIADGQLLVTCGGLNHGFVDAASRLAVITGNDISGGRGASTKDMRKMPARRRNTIDPLELKTGDFVVHEQHGIGRYIELVQRTVNGADREYLVIEYAAAKRGQPGDRLYVPTDQLDQLSRYVGGEQPTLHKMGGADWQKSKARAKKAVKEIAAQLIQLYAARQASKGHAFGPDTPWQRELEDAFPYTETPDQLAAIHEVKHDMELQTPMDRLICGDVGYGKTEIAVRAAFKAVQDGKQVAVLVPTTLLAQQHFNTFTERMSQFPVQIKQLSRFQTPKEAALTLEQAAEGTADIVIGTHRLLAKSTRFKNLGLIIVDEEQRFGVEHKEQLKALRASVDVLTMSATPIPRTLEMAITGIREMSTIATPPEERHPVLTYVGAYDDKQVAAAIHRELLRDGQVFYLHNRVESIDRAARKLRELVPEARVAVAHGQMSEEQLEKVMVGFWEKEFDVLVCTTIVESGIDIPNANTLILERADLLGLAQLHQIRGRVGRGRERAYAYFLYPRDKPLTEHAHERLATIAQHTELGAGMYVAMKDLEIRGAGNLLGGEQSGHIEGVGFDLYVRMVGEAVSAFKGERPEEEPEVKIDLPVDAHLPTEYIAVERLRLEMYRKLAEARDDARLEEVIAEMTDRYGEPPAPVVNLIAVARFRQLARAYGLTDVSMQGKHLRFAPLALPDSKQLRLKRYHPDSVYKPANDQVSVPRPSTRRVGGEPLRDQELLQWCAQLLKDVLGEAPAPARV